MDGQTTHSAWAVVRSRAAGTVQEVLPHTGLAHVVDDGGRSWGLTCSMPGPGLLALDVGSRVDLTIEDHGDFRLVSAYSIKR